MGKVCGCIAQHLLQQLAAGATHAQHVRDAISCVRGQSRCQGGDPTLGHQRPCGATLQALVGSLASELDAVMSEVKSVEWRLCEQGELVPICNTALLHSHPIESIQVSCINGLK